MKSIGLKIFILAALLVIGIGIYMELTNACATGRYGRRGNTINASLPGAGIVGIGLFMLLLLVILLMSGKKKRRN